MAALAAPKRLEGAVDALVKVCLHVELLLVDDLRLLALVSTLLGSVLLATPSDLLDLHAGVVEVSCLVQDPRGAVIVELDLFFRALAFSQLEASIGFLLQC